MEILQVFQLPDDVAALAAAATAEGHQHVNRLIEEFHSGDNCFQKPGEALFVAVSNDDLIIAVGGLNVDPYTSGSDAGRVRRLYVHQEFRRTGVASALMSRIEAAARLHFSTLQLFTTSCAQGKSSPPGSNSIR